jgi:tryptophanyl-tRNA synthetase
MRLFSGMRPTGRLHLGHLVGALENWTSLQRDYDCFFTIADWHALTTGYADTASLPANTMEMAQSWRALGIDFEKSVVFVQSEVKEHTELHLILSMVTPMPWLERDPTLKAMLEDMHIRGVNYGLMGYPVLQAADILLYKATAVPVGIDQAPHVELSREIARAFNRHFSEVFPEPQALLTAIPKLLGTDGRKMSKSLDNCIYLDDAPEDIGRKVVSLVTDPAKVHADDPGNPDICSVQDYHKVFRPGDAPDHDRDCRAGQLGCVAHKKRLGDILSGRLEEYRETRASLKGREDETRLLLKGGAARAREAAQATMAEVRRAVNLPPGI